RGTLAGLAEIAEKRNMKGEMVLVVEGKGQKSKSGDGGFMDMDETLEEAAVRELEEETGLTGISLQQLHAFSALDRDPRHRTVSVAFYGVLEGDQTEAVAGSDAKEVAWFKLNHLPPLAFDHDEILKIAFGRLL
ncbi:MAG TPA: NUDIX domain-containing protein, partial [Bacteroidales bacterium]|nr:NUDIX domain-containing protein [Bacteroidales bacterium]